MLVCLSIKNHTSSLGNPNTKVLCTSWAGYTLHHSVLSQSVSSHSVAWQGSSGITLWHHRSIQCSHLSHKKGSVMVIHPQRGSVCRRGTQWSGALLICTCTTKFLRHSNHHIKANKSNICTVNGNHTYLWWFTTYWGTLNLSSLWNLEHL